MKVTNLIRVAGGVLKTTTFALPVLLITSLFAQGITVGADNNMANIDERRNLSVAYEVATVNPAPINLAEVTSRMVYPKECKNVGVEGKVYIRVLVDAYGNVVQHKVLCAENTALMAVCEKEVYSLKFVPGTVDGTSVNAWVTIPFKFKIM
jgi:TonB family protein